MDFREEQVGEVEALMCIYPNEIIMLSEDPYEFTISLGSSSPDDDDKGSAELNGYFVQVKFKLPPTYPDAPPEMELDEKETNLSEEQLEELKAHLVEQAAENLGMVMVFTLVSATLEWTTALWDKGIKEEKDRIVELEILRAEAEEAEQNRFEGTRVSVITFMAWKAGFDAELAQKRKETDALTDAERVSLGKKLTGRELFLRDKTLYESDILADDEKEFGEDDFVNDEPGKTLIVPIDESLFEDLDDLELEDD